MSPIDVSYSPVFLWEFFFILGTPSSYEYLPNSKYLLILQTIYEVELVCTQNNYK